MNRTSLFDFITLMLILGGSVVALSQVPAAVHDGLSRMRDRWPHARAIWFVFGLGLEGLALGLGLLMVSELLDLAGASTSGAAHVVLVLRWMGIAGLAVGACLFVGWVCWAYVWWRKYRDG